MLSRWQGYNAPFVGGNQTLMSLQADERLIKNDILQLLLTSPGERVMRPDFGTVVRKAPFEQGDSRLMNAIKDSIMEALSIYEPRVEINDIQLTMEPDRNKLDIKVFITIKHTGRQTVVETVVSV